LQNIYQLDDHSVRALISNRLKGNAAKWQQSCLESMTMPVNELLYEMENIFDNRESQLAMKRKFEKKIWQSDESFQEYFYEKLILSNKINISQEELLEHLIDGIPDYALRNQAKMQRFSNTAELLDAFKKIQLKQIFVKNNNKVTLQADTNKSAIVIKCYNCNSKGHTANECRKSKWEPESCFVCAEMGRTSINCPKRKNINPLESTSNSKSFVRKIEYLFTKQTNNLILSLETLIDTGRFTYNSIYHLQSLV